MHVYMIDLEELYIGVCECCGKISVLEHSHFDDVIDCYPHLICPQCLCSGYGKYLQMMYPSTRKIVFEATLH
jgi:hypothetical protein